MITIRMARGGRVKRPVFTIVVADSRCPRDGKFIEKLGQYNPTATPVLNGVKVEEIKAWIGKGAKLSDTGASLLKKNQIKL